MSAHVNLTDSIAHLKLIEQLLVNRDHEPLAKSPESEGQQMHVRN